MQPGFSAAPISFAMAPQAPTGTHRMTRSASLHRRSRRGMNAVNQTELHRGFPRLLALCIARNMRGDFLAPHDMGQRRADKAEADQCHAFKLHAHVRKSVRAATTARLASSSPMVRRRQLRQAIGLHAPQNDPVLIQIGIGHRRCFLSAGSKMHEQEISDARRDLEAQRLQLLASAGQATSHYAQSAVSTNFWSPMAATPAAIAARTHIERPANPVQHVGHMGRAIGPAQAQAPQARRFSRRCASSPHCRTLPQARGPIHNHCA